ncbi:MAG: HAD family phosphatase [Lachnospiraceae bacterium]|nr:HAD family phosphatase [Lachnospiraceae bacterium]
MIRHLVFDVGGVLLDYTWSQMLAEFGMPKDECEIFDRFVLRSPCWSMLDLGFLSFEDVRKDLKLMYPQYADALDYVLGKPERMPVPRPRVEARIRELKAKGYDVYLLSNYSEFLFNTHAAQAHFLDLVDGAVISYEVHTMKPEPRIYETLLQKYDLDPKECMFFDDKPENVEAAVALGFEGGVITSEERLLELLEDY